MMMDLYETQKIETPRKSNYYYYYAYDFLKKALQFLVPLSLMSFLLSSNFHFSSALIFPLLPHVFERKYMFLICNGILAFLAKTLSFTPSFTITNDLEFTSTSPPYKIQSSDSDSDTDIDHGNEFGKGVSDVARKSEDETKDAHLQHENEKQEEGIFGMEDEDESEDGDLKGLEMGKGEGEDGGDQADSLQLDDDGEEENEMNINTEELNRKVEEFIRKMKEEIRIEAKQQLIAA